MPEREGCDLIAVDDKLLKNVEKDFRSSFTWARYNAWLSSSARRCVLSPAGESKQKEVRHLDIHGDDQLDEANSPLG
jgi:hypothetical protein